MTDPLAVAVVGAGQMGRLHVRVTTESEATELTAVVDPDPAAERLARSWRTTWYPGVDELLAGARPDLAVVTVPTSQHAPVALALLDAGVPVLVEKPIATTVEDGEAIVAAAASRGLPLAVGHVERFNPAVRALQARLAEEALGRVFQVRTERLSPFPARIGDTGVAFDLATHDLDLMCELAGSPLRVHAEIDRKAHRSREDLVTATLRFDSGIVGLLEANWLTPAKVRRLTATGERGMFVVDLLAQHLTLYENAHESESWLQLDVFDGVTEGDVVRYAIPRSEPLKEQLEAFARAVRDGEPVLVPGADGLRAVRLALALVESGETGRTVELAAAAA